ncbi:DUF6087 family protein [Streptomyces sp. APSN-46.1]|uniref:DUF6087 family protein n=1 Tax=Streptomyces sp. APSN-46.1 TaxID=2929049 RepID=UPI001FB2A06D|nr:DUF6087 family protein [Streptomyces sp. APSN-46.1]MCJ1680495.1 DUF6087 family protein [Streptomyces sp. APSN-46.1]
MLDGGTTMDDDGFAWRPLAAVENYAAACRMLNPAPQPQQSTQPEPKKQPGRHRKP